MEGGVPEVARIVSIQDDEPGSGSAEGGSQMFATGNLTEMGRDEARLRVIADVAQPSIPLIDERRLQNVTFGDPVFRAELLAMFFEEATRQMTVLSSALATGSSDSALRAAHALKGASANVGAVCMLELSRELEAVVRSGGLEFTAPLLDRLFSAQQATRATLREE
jgi:HPt (histidine-containing phosphotransfer) domain-containing protein